MAFAEQLAAEKGMKHIFALSTQARSIISSKRAATSEVTARRAPAPSAARKYDASARKSKVLLKAHQLSRPAVRSTVVRAR